MTDKEFKLEVLSLTLSNGTAAVQADPLATAQQYLEWCLQPIDKPEAQKATASPGRKLNQDKR